MTERADLDVTGGWWDSTDTRPNWEDKRQQIGADAVELARLYLAEFTAESGIEVTEVNVAREAGRILRGIAAEKDADAAELDQ